MTHTLAIEVLKAAAEEHRKSHDGWMDQANNVPSESGRANALACANGRLGKCAELLEAVRVLEEDAKIETVIEIQQTEKPPNRNCPECGKQYFIDWRGGMVNWVLCKTPGCSKAGGNIKSETFGCVNHEPRKEENE
jgi:hypothetical protein